MSNADESSGTDSQPSIRSAGMDLHIDLKKEQQPKVQRHKEKVITLLQQVCTVSIATMEIVDGMAQ